MPQNPFLDPGVAKQVLDYVIELEKLMEENYLKPVEQTTDVLARIIEIRQELNRMGLYFTYEVSVTFDPIKGAIPKADIKVWVPKPNMSPAEQEIYDNWYAKANDLPRL